jgi:hypothetical protein
MTAEFAAAVCEGFCGSLEELLGRDLGERVRNILVDLQEHTEAAIQSLSGEYGEVVEVAENHGIANNVPALES